jgi:hypothetical protein
MQPVQTKTHKTDSSPLLVHAKEGLKQHMVSSPFPTILLQQRMKLAQHVKLTMQMSNIGKFITTLIEPQLVKTAAT